MGDDQPPRERRHQRRSERQSGRYQGHGEATIAREPTGGGGGQRDIDRAGGEPNGSAISRQEDRKTLRLARHDEAKTLQQPAEQDDHARTVPVEQPAPKKPTDTHPEKGEGRGSGNPRAGPTEGLGHWLQEDAKRHHAAHADAAYNDADGDNHPAVSQFHPDFPCSLRRNCRRS